MHRRYPRSTTCFIMSHLLTCKDYVCTKHFFQKFHMNQSFCINRGVLHTSSHFSSIFDTFVKQVCRSTQKLSQLPLPPVGLKQLCSTIFPILDCWILVSFLESPWREWNFLRISWMKKVNLCQIFQFLKRIHKFWKNKESRSDKFEAFSCIVRQ